MYSVVALAVNKEICCVAEPTHIYIYEGFVESSCDLLVLKKKITCIRVYVYEVEMRSSQYYTRHVYLTGANKTLYFKKLLSVCILFLFVMYIYYVYVHVRIPPHTHTHIISYKMDGISFFIFHSSFCFLGLNFWVTCVGNC